jgi:hypothetical protein
MAAGIRKPALDKDLPMLARLFGPKSEGRQKSAALSTAKCLAVWPPRN